jgi:ribosome recycling factor
MTEEELAAELSACEEKMRKAVAHTQGQLATVRTSRATPALVEDLVVDYYGAPTRLKQLATFQVPEARVLVISPFDKNSIKSIEKALLASELGVTPTVDGEVIRLVFPPLTEERRKELVKVVRHLAEEGRVALRNIRRSTRQHLEKAEKEGSLAAHDVERAEKQLEKLVEKYISEIDSLLARKEKELLEE